MLTIYERMLNYLWVLLMAVATRRSKGNEAVRDRLLDAVDMLMRKRGLARVTTRDVAQAAGVAEGTLYNHFRDKSALLIAFVQRTAPATMRQAMMDLPLRVGQRSVRVNVEGVLGAALSFHRRMAPVICSLLADTSLMVAARRELKTRGLGPNLSADRLAAYLDAERKLGRVSPKLAAAAAADLLLGASFKLAVTDHLFGNPVGAANDRKQLKKLVGALLGGAGVRARRKA